MTNSVEIDEGGNGEHADVLVCVRLTQPLLMPDNQISLCDACGEAVQHRAHAPKLPRKLCWECAEHWPRSWRRRASCIPSSRRKAPPSWRPTWKRRTRNE